MKLLPPTILLAAALPMALPFAPSPWGGVAFMSRGPRDCHPRAASTRLLSGSSSAGMGVDVEALGLTPELARLTEAFRSIGDDKLRYKQLLFLAQQLPPMEEALKTPANKVPGCLSTVHVHAAPDPAGGGRVTFQGDSDGLLTKGLVALLVRGLSGSSVKEIQNIDPRFIQVAGIDASLTPGRNSGFLNMLAVMQRQAAALEEEEGAATGSGSGGRSRSDEADGDTGTAKAMSKYDAIVAALRRSLQPAWLDLVDNSHLHAGHAGYDVGGESHFDLYIVSEAFEGLNLVKRHKLVYSTLGELMTKIHALQIRAQTPSEAAK